jgi:hypothetical protein
MSRCHPPNMNHSLSCPLSGVAGGNDGRLCVPHSFTEDSNDIGIECVQTHNEQTTNFCILKKQTLQTGNEKKRRLQICVVSKSRHYKLCNENRQAPQSFIVSKSGHYKLCNENRHPSQTFVASKSGHYKLCNENRQALQTFIVSKSGHYKLL